MASHYILANSVYTPTTTFSEVCFPLSAAYNESYLRVSDLHILWYAEYGSPSGMPVVVVHGGPGGGCGPNDMRYFDPHTYRIILFDQRGAPRSKPVAEMRENTTAHLIGDLEALRQHLGIRQWLLFGGSWGSTLSLAYAEAHPASCLGLILRGVFLGSRSEYEQLWYGMADCFPREWEEMTLALPENERGDLITSYHKRLLDPDPAVHMPVARAFVKYDLIASFFNISPEVLSEIMADEALVLGVARAFSHYGQNGFFLEDNQLLRELGRVAHLPCTIVHGRYDMVCRLKQAYKLHRAWPGSQLIVVPDAGHAASEPGMARALVCATQHFQRAL